MASDTNNQEESCHTLQPMSTAALFLLSFKEKYWLSEAAINFAVGSVQNILKVYSLSVEAAMEPFENMRALENYMREVSNPLTYGNGITETIYRYTYTYTYMYVYTETIHMYAYYAAIIYILKCIVTLCMYIIDQLSTIFFNRTGPLMNTCCMRMEAKNCYSKQLTKLSNFKNVPYTVAQRHQRLMCAYLQSSKFWDDGIQSGPGINTVIAY